jgi:hypothetical protein
MDIIVVDGNVDPPVKKTKMPTISEFNMSQIHEYACEKDSHNSGASSAGRCLDVCVYYGYDPCLGCWLATVRILRIEFDWNCHNERLE